MKLLICATVFVRIFFYICKLLTQRFFLSLHNKLESRTSSKDDSDLDIQYESTFAEDDFNIVKNAPLEINLYTGCTNGEKVMINLTSAEVSFRCTAHEGEIESCTKVLDFIEWAYGLKANCTQKGENLHIVSITGNYQGTHKLRSALLRAMDILDQTLTPHNTINMQIKIPEMVHSHFIITQPEDIPYLEELTNSKIIIGLEHSVSITGSTFWVFHIKRCLVEGGLIKLTFDVSSDSDLTNMLKEIDHPVDLVIDIPRGNPFNGTKVIMFGWQKDEEYIYDLQRAIESRDWNSLRLKWESVHEFDLHD